MTAVSSSDQARSRRELAALLVAGAAGAGVVLLAARQALARVVTLPPTPLPATTTEVSGQDLRPAIAALAVAALASLAAVLATRGVLRRITGLITSALGAGIVGLAVGPVSAAEAVAAAGRSSLSPAVGAGAGAAAGSVTAGSGAGGSGGVGGPGGFPVHVVLAGAGWRVVLTCGAALLVVTGIVILARAGRLPAMSRRYEWPARLGGPAPVPATAGDPGPARASAGSGMWESLSAGEDPTDWPQ